MPRPRPSPRRPSRRKLLRWGIGLGATATAGTFGAHWLLPPSPRADGATFAELVEELVDRLDPDDRAVACMPYDSPWRQVHNRGVWGAGLDIRPWSQSGAVRQLVSDLMYAGLSPVGRERVPRQQFLDWPGVHLARLLICGLPSEGACTAMLSAPHLNLRLGGESTDGAVFGGPQVYGDQRGDGGPGLDDNVYLPQLHAAHAVFDAMTPAQRSAARVHQSPVQTRIAVQGAGGEFDGVLVGELGERARGLARDAVARILETWAPADVEQAWAALEAHGGVDGLHLADYDIDHLHGEQDDMTDATGKPSTIFRFEGPGAVLFFRGEPHLHAFVNVAADGERPLSVGDVVGDNPVAMDERAVGTWYDRVMCERTGAELSYYAPNAVAGRLRAGTIRTGDLYALESWGDHIDVLELHVGDVPPFVQTTLEFRGGDISDPDRLVRVAINSGASEFERLAVGRPQTREQTGVRLRDALVDHARTHGFTI